MKIKKTIRIPEDKGSRFMLTGIEVLGYATALLPLIEMSLQDLNKKNTGTIDYELPLIAIDTDEQVLGTYRWNLTTPTSLPYVRYEIDATNFDVRNVNLLGYVTEISF